MFVTAQKSELELKKTFANQRNLQNNFETAYCDHFWLDQKSNQMITFNSEFYLITFS